MKKQKVPVISLLIAGIFVIAAVYMFDTRKTATNDIVTLPSHDKKSNIGYYEGGPYINYTLYIRAVVHGLVEAGLMEPIDIPEFQDPEDSHAIWNFLSRNAKSASIEFRDDAYWTAGWNKERRKEIKEAIIGRLSAKKDIGLMLAMGTWAGQDLANNRHSVPTMVLSTSDPVGAGIVKSVKDSGRDHIFARCDPKRYSNQVWLFHDIFGFKKIGVAFEDSHEGRLYANVESLKKVAAARGFDVVECHARDIGLTDDECKAEILRCYQELAPRIDALWIGLHRGENVKYMPEILKPLFDRRIPTWYQEGSKGVRRGALMSFSHKNFHYVGLWAGEIIKKILAGSKPRDLDQVFEHPKRISINMETARLIGFVPPEGIMSTADEIYNRIEE